jgi:hypothetical protein
MYLQIHHLKFGLHGTPDDLDHALQKRPRLGFSDRRSELKTFSWIE